MLHKTYLHKKIKTAGGLNENVHILLAFSWLLL